MIMKPASLIILTLLSGLTVCGLPPLSRALPAKAVPGERVEQAMVEAPPLGPLLHAPSSELREVIERYGADRAALYRRYDVDYSPARRSRLREFYGAWRSRLREIDFEALTQEGRIDYLLLDGRLQYELSLLDREEKRFSEMAAMVPFAGAITQLQEARRRMEPVDPKAAASTLAGLPSAIDGARRAVETSPREKGDAAVRPSGELVARAANAVDNLRSTLGQWYRFYSGYDPVFTWWAADPYKKADEALRAYSGALRARTAGDRDGHQEPVIGDPIGAEGLKADLALERIPYSPEELVAIADREFAWCEAEMRKAARDMGFGDDWKAAVEKVKTMHVEPGRQPDLIRDLAREAIDFVEQRDLVTVPPLAKEIWRMEMMSPERQRVTPFFTGGEVISVSFPTDAMDQEDKLMTMRGNNIPFSRATVFHELIPGHHLQAFMISRYNTHRQAFGTPFWTEGWALYWEMLLWDQGFPRTPEERVGMLFWRMHRAARIVFSLSFHLGKMTPQQAVDYLVDRVGHERANAAAEVRRSFNGTYPPLYQAAYMLGGLQFRALHRELVDSGKMTNRRFHDTILQGGPMPVEMVRARLTGQPLKRDQPPGWRFAGN
jgi:uncharacterized protein (DUF885 family)